MDPHTKTCIDCVYISASMNELAIFNLLVAYPTVISRNLLELLEYRLVHYESIHTVAVHISRIIIPQPLRRIIFTLIHTSPSFGHMDEHKILYRIRLRFFLPRLRSNIAEWIK